jgi:osmotically-inducible protein OsmY
VAITRPACDLLLVVVLLAGCAATTNRTADDLTTTTQVKIALVSDAQAGGLRLNVSTFQGVVTLSGTVKSDADARRAIALARAPS